MKVSVMSILIDSNLNYEFPYQIGAMFYQEFNNNFEEVLRKENKDFIDWELSLNMTHSNHIKRLEIKGPDIDKRNKIVTFSIFNGTFLSLIHI